MTQIRTYSKWGSLCLALGSGIAMGLTSAPTEWWILAWIAQTPLWILIYRHSQLSRSHSAERTSKPTLPLLFLSLLWGCGYYGTTLSWITGLHPLTWMGIPWGASVAIALTCWFIVTLWGCVWSMAWAWGLAMVTRSIAPKSSSAKPRLLLQGVTRVLAGTALWCGLDTLWNQGILYWPTLALTQSPHNLVVLHLNQLSGPITTTALIVAVNGLLAEAWIAYRVRVINPAAVDSPHRRRFEEQEIGERLAPVQPINIVAENAPLVYLSKAVLLIAIAHLIGAWLYGQPLQATPQDGLSVGLIQGNIPTRIKLTSEGIRRAFEHYTKGYGNLADQGVDLVLLPEGALPVLWAYPYYQQNSVFQAIRDRQTPAIVGTFVPIASPSDDDERDRPRQPIPITQSLLLLTGTTEDKVAWTSASNQQTPAIVAQQHQSLDHQNHGNNANNAQYNKIKLVPLGEYIPAEGLLGAIISRLSPIESSMQPGRTDQIFQTPWGRAIAGICYESAFPELFRRQTAAGGEFILTASNNDPYSSAMMAQHHAQDVMRAIESDRWAVRVTNTGYSGLVNPHGETVWRSQRNTYETYIAQINRRQTQTLYVRWGNWLTPVLIVLALPSVIALCLRR